MHELPRAEQVAADLAAVTGRLQRTITAAQHSPRVVSVRTTNTFRREALAMIRDHLGRRGWRVWAVEDRGGDAWLAVLGRRLRPDGTGPPEPADVQLPF